MKTTAFLFLLLFSSSAYSQFEIPNGEFEDWTMGTWNLNPTHWQTNNWQLTQDVFQDSAAYQGEFAMRVEAAIVELGSYGQGSIEIPTEAIPPALNFYAKWERTYTAGVGVEIAFYNADALVYQQYWTPDAEASEWVPITMPLSQIEPVMTHVIIRVQANVGDFAPGEAWIAVDAMSVGSPNGTDELMATSFNMYPVPVIDVLNLEVDQSIVPRRVAITDATGRRIKEVPYARRIDMQDVDRGFYTLTLFDEQGRQTSKAFIVE